MKGSAEVPSGYCLLLVALLRVACCYNNLQAMCVLESNWIPSYWGHHLQQMPKPAKERALFDMSIFVQLTEKYNCCTCSSWEMGETGIFLLWLEIAQYSSPTLYRGVDRCGPAQYSSYRRPYILHCFNRGLHFPTAINSDKLF